MSKLTDIIFYDSLPKLDLHGYDRETARVAINDFVNDNMKIKKEIIMIVHGVGSGVLATATDDTLRKNKNVIEFKRVFNNNGCTVALIKLVK